MAHVVDQRFDIRCARLTLGIDDEVRVLVGDARAADRVSLESAGFDEARCMIAGRIAKYAAVCLGSTVVDRVSIGENTVVGSGSLVTRSLPANVLAYGAPAKVVRKRKLGERFLK